MATAWHAGCTTAQRYGQVARIDCKSHKAPRGASARGICSRTRRLTGVRPVLRAEQGPSSPARLPGDEDRSLRHLLLSIRARRCGDRRAPRGTVACALRAPLRARDLVPPGTRALRLAVRLRADE